MKNKQLTQGDKFLQTIVDEAPETVTHVALESNPNGAYVIEYDAAGKQINAHQLNDEQYIDMLQPLLGYDKKVSVAPYKRTDKIKKILASKATVVKP